MTVLLWGEWGHIYWGYHLFTYLLGDSLVAKIVKRLPTIQETRAQSLGREDPLEKEMATHSSVLAWEIL